MQSHREQIDEDDLPLRPAPPSPSQSSVITKKKRYQTTLVAENAKRGKKKGPKFADV